MMDIMIVQNLLFQGLNRREECLIERPETLMPNSRGEIEWDF
jgi:hypothetical protein